jgi:hypothetical protein
MPPRAANAGANGHGELWDLESAARAAEAEAGPPVPFPFTYKGEKYEIAPMARWPVKALSAVSSGDLDTALALLLGDEAYDKLAEAGLDFGQMNALFDKLAADGGMGNLPNSGPPPRRSSTRA